MFTGIVEEAAQVADVRATDHAIKLLVRSRVCSQGLKPGASLAVNGCCLTVVKTQPSGPRHKLLQFDLLAETWRLTNLQFTKPGSLVNLERPLRADGRLDGHFVTGHIDGLGRVLQWKPVGADHFLEIAAGADIMRYIILKGSIALDGISLTVAKAGRKTFGVWIIPHTLEVTALKERKVGDAVNLEADLVGKYVERFTAKA